MPTFLTTAASAQDGDLGALGSAIVWDDTATTLRVGLNSGITKEWIGLCFDFPVPTLNDPPIVSAATITLDPNTSVATGTATARVTVYVVPDPLAAAYSDTLRPGDRGEIRSNTKSDLTWTNGVNPSTQTLTLDGAALSALNAVVGNEAYTGRLCISVNVDITSTGSTDSITFESAEGSATFPTLTTTDSDFYTGWLGMPMTGRGRGVTDDRFGMPIFSPDRVLDGFSLGLRVRPNDVDPEEALPNYIPSPDEGGFNDEPRD